jgi:hypothetical protein
MRVKVGEVYTYNPNPIEVLMGGNTAEAGQRVRVVELPNAPAANTAGNCHVEDLDGNLLGMVGTASLSR